MIVAFPALGTTAVLAVADEDVISVARAALECELLQVDAACSRFRADSELSRINASGGSWVPVSAYLYEALRVALHAAAATDGIVDPTVGRPLRLAGYDATYRIVCRRDGDTFQPRFEAAAGWQTVELDDARRSVRLPVGVELDLGATAKALAADRAAKAAAEASECGVLVSLGGDVAVAGEAPADGWPIGIADDHNKRSDVTVAIAAGGLATSSVTVRRWRAGAVELHHVLNPRTGRSAETCWRSVSVASASCVDANVAATASIVLASGAPQWLAASGLSARLVRNDNAVELVGDWPVAA